MLKGGFILTQRYLIPSNGLSNSKKTSSLIVHIVGWVNQDVLYKELIEHETCSDVLLSLLQNISIFQYWNYVSFNNMTIYTNLNYISHKRLYIKLLITEIGVYL